MNKTSVTLLLILSAATANAIEPADPARLDEVVERGSKVMPFNLEKTLHLFNKTETGGVQQVIAKDAADVEQIALTRKHLAEIAASFAQGDFSGPQKIHGNDMPGVQELSAGARQVRFVYQDLPDGGQIEYVTDKPELISAIHQFFDAQLSDHARHAMPGEHAQHHGHQP
jgi:hypothetical protein